MQGTQKGRMGGGGAQVCVERRVCQGPERVHDQGPDGDVCAARCQASEGQRCNPLHAEPLHATTAHKRLTGDKSAVHDVHVDPLCSSIQDCRHLLMECNRIRHGSPMHAGNGRPFWGAGPCLCRRWLAVWYVAASRACHLLAQLGEIC